MTKATGNARKGRSATRSAATPPPSSDSLTYLVVRQVKSEIGLKPTRRKTLASGLGLRGIGQTRVHRQTRSVLKMIEQVSNLVEVHEVEQEGTLGSPVTEPSLDVHNGGPVLTEALYETDGGPAIYFGLEADAGIESAPASYVAAERHKDFFSLVWSTPLSLAAAVEELLGSFPRNGPHPHRTAQAVFIDQDGVHKTGLKEALAQARSSTRPISLLRLEFPAYTFVWRGPSKRGQGRLAEIGMMCTVPDDAFLVELVERTGTEMLKKQSWKYVHRALQVVAADVASG
ncbi:50S ribosomal protein L30 [Geodermatophilus sp. URMC 63]